MDGQLRSLVGEFFLKFYSTLCCFSQRSVSSWLGLLREEVQVFFDIHTHPGGTAALGGVTTSGVSGSSSSV